MTDTDRADRMEHARGVGDGLVGKGRNDAQPVGTMLVTTREDQQMVAWNATEQAYPRAQCVPQLVARQAAATPDAVAVEDGSRTLTYRALNQQANLLAHHLRALGVGLNVPVGVCIERSVELVIGLLGVLKAGGAYLPLDPAYPSRRLAFMLEDAEAPVLVTQQHLASQVPARGAQVVYLDADAPAFAERSDADPTPLAAAANLAYVIYTSGSTGQPKGVPITHESLLNLIFWHQRAFAVTPADRATQLAGPAFDATGWELWPYLTAGASVHLPDEETRVNPTHLRDWLVRQQITISFVPTALAEPLIGLEWPRETVLRVLLTGADRLHRYPAPGLPFTLVNNYGPTESTVVTTSGPVPAASPADPPTQPPTIGKPIANTQVYILDDQLRQVPIGTPGELYIGGAGLSSGYLNRPDLTRERFIAHPFSDTPGARLYRTGDLAQYLPDGQLAFLGRVDDQVKIRGYRIELGEIAAALDGHPTVQTSVVTARAVDPGAREKALVAYIVPAPGTMPQVSALQEYLRASLPDYMVPATFVALEALPLTPNGKVDRAALPAPEASNTLRDDTAPGVDALTPVEERIAGIVSELLHVEQVELDDNFFMLGGHSMLGTQLITRVADTFGVTITLRTLFDAPTVRALASEVERQVVTMLEAMSDEEVQRLLA